MKQIKRITVTGVAGFIGSNLTKALLQKGYRVTGLDNLSQGLLCNIEPFLSNKYFKFIKGDVRSVFTVAKSCLESDCIVHLAAFKIPRYGNAYDTLMVNSQGTLNVLETARKIKAKMIFASTSDVYGKSPDLPFKEDGDLVLGHSRVKRWAYAVSKLFDEHLCFAYEEKYGIDVCVLRFFGSYGPNQNLTWWGGPQSVFIAAALKGEPLQVHGDGKQTRSFTYIDDTVEGIIRAIERKTSSGEIFNIGNNKEISIIELARLIWKLARGNGPTKISFIPYHRFSEKYQDVRRRVPDLSKSKRILGFQPKVELKEGLIKTIAWQKTVSAR